ncbi:photosystem reaction center subunit H [Hypericibacter terrae]|jgi:hypothetical protein|uniref:Photosystem reaction center subunit H n=1 Tax=Hypericibacter terrae TaxID=2602015 RepID=A0A5J6MH67_9PROT|nr:PRC-barrel domain-containing protein [Hypericibacter terrae]QEX16789.1 photosystem reaction center subunit H [Hypericibacter terrae]
MASPLPKTQSTLEQRETYSLIGANKVNGTHIYNPKGDHLGEVDEIMIDKLSGKVAYAVATFGGFLGLGQSRYALPWSVLSYDTGKSGYVVALDAEKLKKAPRFENESTLADREWGKSLHDYYGIPPYWL